MMRIGFFVGSTNYRLRNYCFFFIYWLLFFQRVFYYCPSLIKMEYMFHLWIYYLFLLVHLVYRFDSYIGFRDLHNSRSIYISIDNASWCGRGNGCKYFHLAFNWQKNRNFRKKTHYAGSKSDRIWWHGLFN